MLKAEIKRLLQSYMFYIMFALIIGAFIYVISDYYGNFGYITTYSGYGVKKYENFDEVLRYQIEQEENLAELEELLAGGNLPSSERKEVLLYISDTETLINVYQYIIDNQIPYSNYRDFSGTCGIAADNAFSALSWIYWDGMATFIPFVLGIMAAIYVPIDFHIGTYKFLYSTSVKRKTVIKNRYATWLLFAGTTSLTCCIVSSVISFTCGSTAGSLICANADMVFSLNYLCFWLIESLDIIFRTATFGTLVFGISLMFKYFYISTIANICIFVVNFFVYLYDNPFLNMVINGISRVFICSGAAIWYIPVYVILLPSIATIFLFLGYSRFVKRDFT